MECVCYCIFSSSVLKNLLMFVNVCSSARVERLKKLVQTAKTGLCPVLNF